MTKFFRKMLDRRAAFFVCMGIYAVLSIVSEIYLQQVYTFSWTVRNKYCFTWVAVLILLVFDNSLPAYFITIGNVVGTVVGEFLGSFIVKQNLSRAASQSEIRFITNNHPGQYIWGVTLFVFIAVYVALSITFSVRKKRALKSA